MNKKVPYKKYIPVMVFFLLILVLLSGVSTSYGREITRMELEEVTDLIMSPGCNYTYTLTNCPSAQAEQMRELIKDRLRKGESKEEILSYFEKVYGTKILAQPSKKGFYFVAWWFPYFLMLDIFIVVGIFLFLWRKRNYKKEETDTAVNPDMETLLEDEVRKFKERE
ncbi:MAG: hypothetical protein GXP46_07765 [Deferribacteres bacterium]|nr:hypothetical protein [Deferribacteres bacterium]